MSQVESCCVPAALYSEVIIKACACRACGHRIEPGNEYIDPNDCRDERCGIYGPEPLSVVVDARVTPAFIQALEKKPNGAGIYIIPELTGRAQRKASATRSSAGAPKRACCCSPWKAIATAPKLMMLFGWSNMKTAQIYVAQADKRRMAANAQERLAAHGKSQSVSKSETKKRNRTKGAKSQI